MRWGRHVSIHRGRINGRRRIRLAVLSTWRCYSGGGDTTDYPVGAVGEGCLVNDGIVNGGLNALASCTNPAGKCDECRHSHRRNIVWSNFLALT